MAYDTVILQGRFTGDGSSQVLSLRSDVDFMWVYNETQLGAQNNVGVQYYWQRGMAAGTGIRFFKSGGVNTLNALTLAAGEGFTLFDSSGNATGNSIAVTATTNATQPVISTANTAGLATGSIVRLIDITNRHNLDGFDFEIDTIVANTSFRMRWPLVNNPGGVGGAGFYRQVIFDPIYYPRRRFIANISQAAQAVVTTTVTNGFTVGQEVRFNIPAEFGMIQLNGLSGTIVAINAGANTFTVDIDSSAFTTFAFPGNAAVPFTFAQVVPLGEDTGIALALATDILADATINQAALGIILAGGPDSPGGDAGDVMYWVAGKSFSVTNL